MDRLNRPPEPYSDRPVEHLSDGEWRVLMAWRMSHVEKRLDSLFRALMSLVGTVAAGVLIYLLTSVGAT